MNIHYKRNMKGKIVKTIVITGASSGIGKATAKYFAEQGWQVAATMRKPEKETELPQVQNVKLYHLDVTDENSISEARDNILKDFGGINVVLNNAGYGLVGAFEAASEEQIKRQFDTNLFGLMAVTRAFLPHFRANKTGTFINVSSIGGLVTFPFISLYHSTKWAVEGFSESLSYELAELGLKVRIIEPGAIATDFGERSLVFATNPELNDYNESIVKFQAAMENMAENASPASLVAEVIYQAAIDESDKLRYLVGGDAEQAYELRKSVGDLQFISSMKERFFS